MNVLEKKFKRKRFRNKSKHVKSDSNAICGKKYPWIARNYTAGIIGLHEEIEDFCKYMQPFPEEVEMRNYVIQSVKDIVTSLWPKAEIEVFGSFSTGLYLPSSDIDIVVFGNWKYLPLFTLKEAIFKDNIAVKSSLQVIDRAMVPIVKFEHKLTRLSVDISFNKSNGVQCVQLIKKFLDKFPVLSKLMLVLKQFLFIRDLNEVYSGGISSYSLFLLCVSFLQLHPRKDARSPDVNLGVLLIEFFELYGPYFNYDSVSISVKNGGSYMSKREFYDQVSRSPSMLSIEDPVTSGNDVARGSYAMPQIQEAFDFAYRILTTAVIERNFQLFHPEVKSYLGLIVKVTKQWFFRRNDVVRGWRKFVDVKSKETNQLKRNNDIFDDESDSSENFIRGPKKSKLEIIKSGDETS